MGQLLGEGDEKGILTPYFCVLSRRQDIGMTGLAVRMIPALCHLVTDTVKTRKAGNLAEPYFY